MSATEPSRRSSGRRRRELRALALQLDARYGPDKSTPIYAFDDGWTLRRIDGLPDQHREGHLMRHCLRAKTLADENCYSLRDADNIPHATFSAWAIDTAAEPEFLGLPPEAARPLFDFCGFLMGRFACFAGEGRQRGRIADQHRDRLRAFAERPCATLPPFPVDPMDRVDALILAIFDHEYTNVALLAQLKRLISIELIKTGCSDTTRGSAQVLGPSVLGPSERGRIASAALSEVRRLQRLLEGMQP